MENKKLKRIKGITLLETLIYVSIFTMFMVIVIQLLLSVQLNNNKVKQVLDLEKDRIFITNHIEELLDSKNREILQENSVFNSDNGSITFLDGESYVKYDIQNNKLVFFDGMNTIPISSSKTVINKFNISKYENEFAEIVALKFDIEIAHVKRPTLTTKITFVKNIL